ncbi:hypothetical protein OIU85_012529 [Salix viminalis]|uniref:Replication protein A C-terminal domain-containing protein n=1 Tax=Salix viminalis TaxID=40686 RepID=A0A9Q0SDY7_SALVM|nr:hypothetical protein OIU85_012529 [Salix viminalis]
MLLENLTRRDLQFSRSTEGAHYDVIARQLNIPTNKLKDELQILVDNGLIYTTINDDYYKSTVNA